ncbi:MAG: hypothetical protein K5888_12665 [Lachnospiraceae bacterium]|nr:hypothetical protein [Lachnospiraceae bacterium]
MNDGFIMLDGSGFANFSDRCCNLFTDMCDLITMMYTDSDLMLSSWYGNAKNEWMKTLRAECEDLTVSMHELSSLMGKVEDAAIGIAGLKIRIEKCLE